MPVVSITLEDTNRSILSGVYHNIIKDIVKATKIPYSALVVLYKDSEVTLTDNRSNESIIEQPNLPSTLSKKRIQATITEEYDEDSLTTTAVNQIAANAIFSDPTVSVSVYPIYIKSAITIEFSYLTPSKIEANRIRDDVRLRLSQSRNIDIHEVEYSILIPEVIENFISDVYDLKNRLDPQPLAHYFKENSSKRIHPITDMSNQSNTKLAIHEKQVRILGLFDFSSMPEKIESDNTSNNYRLSFSYKLALDVPRAMAIRYPVMLCNKLMPSKYLSFIEEHNTNGKRESTKIEGYTSNAMYNLSIFESHRQLEYRTNIQLPIRIPSFDDYVGRQGHKGYAYVASFLSDVNETDLKTLFSLKDISPYELPEVLLDFIKTEEKNYMVHPYTSFLYLGLHQEDRYFDSDTLNIDDELVVSSIKELSLYKPVRVTLSYCLDLSSLNDGVISRLLPKPEMLIFYLKEYMAVLLNYMSEYSLSYTDNIFYRIYIDAISYYLNKSQLDVVSTLLDVLVFNNLIMDNFARILINGHPDLYRTLERSNLIHIDLRTYQVTLPHGEIYTDNLFNSLPTITAPVSERDRSDSRSNISKGIIKSVMSASILALRQ